MEFAGLNSQDAMPIMKEGNSASHQNPCKAPNGRRLRWILFSRSCFLEVVFSVLDQPQTREPLMLASLRVEAPSSVIFVSLIVAGKFSRVVM